MRAIIALHPRPEVRGFTANEVNIEKPYSKRLLFRIFGGVSKSMLISDIAIINIKER